jgi:hypothetical protein
MEALWKLENLIRTYTIRRGADRRNAAYVSPQNHIVIGGCGRSGTTLLRVILDSHPRISCGPESNVFLQPVLQLPRLTRKFKLDSNDLNQAYFASRSRAEFIDRLAQLSRNFTGKPRWAEKTPRNVHNLKFIFDKFPRAKFIHVLRDGRDVVCSLRTHPRHRVVDGKLVPLHTWKPMKYCATRWRDSLLAAKPHMSDPRFHTVRYEQLVTSPRKAISALMDFLGEPWNDALLAHSEAASTFRDVSSFPQNPEALQPIGTTALARWQRDMTEQDKQIFQAIAGDLLIEHGYASDNNWVTAPCAHS